MSYEFDDAVALDANGGADLPERWTMGPGFAHGGYLMSLALAAATLAAPRTRSGVDVRALHATGQGGTGRSSNGGPSRLAGSSAP